MQFQVTLFEVPFDGETKMSLATTQDRARGLRSRSAPSSEVTTPLNNLPPRDPKFVGRFEELHQLSDLLVRNLRVGLYQQPAPHTQGGMGKTATAIAYAWQHLKNYPGGVFFLDASTAPLLTEMAKLSTLLGCAPAPNEQAAAHEVRDRLSLGPAALLIIDGLDESAKWNRAQQMKLIPEGNCRCLITTSRSSLSDVTMCVIGRLPRDHGVRALAGFRPDATDRENEPIAGDIVDMFDGLPIGLSLVGAFMALNPDSTWDSCRERVKKIANATIPDRPRNNPDRGRGQQEVPDFVKLVHGFFDEVLESLPPQLRFGMEYAAHMPSSRIPMSWLSQLSQSGDATKLAKILGGVLTGQQVVAGLLSLQILRAQSPGYKSIGMSRILRRRMKQLFDDGNVQHDGAFDDVITMLGQRANTSELALQKKSIRNELTPLAEFAKELKNKRRFEEASKIANQVAQALHRLGRFHEVIELIDELLDNEVVDEFEPTTVAVLMSDKAVTLCAAGQVDEARRLMDRALQIEQRHLPTDHPTIAAHYSNLAGILIAGGELTKARRFIEQAIQIEEKQFGADNARLGLRHWWLGDIDVAEKKQDEAIARYQRAHEIMAKHFPAEHPHIKNLAKILDRLGRPIPSLN